MKSVVKVQAVQLIPNQNMGPQGPNGQIPLPTEDSVIVQLVGDINLNFRIEASSAPMVGDTFEVELTKVVKLGEQVTL